MAEFTTEMAFELFNRGFRLDDKGGMRRASGSICNYDSWRIGKPRIDEDWQGNPIEIVSVRYESFSEGGGWGSDHEISQFYYVQVDELLEHIDNKHKQKWR